MSNKAKDAAPTTLQDEFGPNPELYDELSQPFDDAELAEKAIDDFIRDVAELRKTYGLPELLIMVAAFHEPAKPGADHTVCKSICFGHPGARPAMGAMVYNLYTLPEIERAENLKLIATQGKVAK